MKIKKLNYFCAVEGQQEKMYLKHLEKLLTDFPRRTVKFNITIGDASELKKSLTEYDKVCLFDHDFKEQEFERNLKTCIEMDTKKRKKSESRVYHAYSNICFDLWLLLHKQDVSFSVSQANGYVNHIRKQYSLSKGSNIKNESEMNKILAQISLANIKFAIKNAERIRENKLSRDKIFVMNEHYYYPAPDFSIDVFLKNVLKNSGIQVT